jgi:hypothetical protein
MHKPATVMQMKSCRDRGPRYGSGQVDLAALQQPTGPRTELIAVTRVS